MYKVMLIHAGFLLMIFFVSYGYAGHASATVYEFEIDGSVTVSEALDYFASNRHQKINQNIFPIHSKQSTGKEFDQYVMKSAQKYRVEPSLIHAVIKAESSYNPYAMSPKGAGGLMQLMPLTAKQYGVQDRFSPEENIDGGTKYLRFLLDRYEGDIELAVAAYNAGEGAVDKYGGVPPYAETKAYVQKISLFIEKDN